MESSPILFVEYLSEFGFGLIPPCVGFCEGLFSLSAFRVLIVLFSIQILIYRPCFFTDLLFDAF